MTSMGQWAVSGRIGVASSVAVMEKGPSFSILGSPSSQDSHEGSLP